VGEQKSSVESLLFLKHTSFFTTCTSITGCPTIKLSQIEDSSMNGDNEDVIKYFPSGLNLCPDAFGNVSTIYSR